MCIRIYIMLLISKYNADIYVIIFNLERWVRHGWDNYTSSRIGFACHSAIATLWSLFFSFFFFCFVFFLLFLFWLPRLRSLTLQQRVFHSRPFHFFHFQGHSLFVDFDSISQSYHLFLIVESQSRVAYLIFLWQFLLASVSSLRNNWPKTFTRLEENLHTNRVDQLYCEFRPPFWSCHFIHLHHMSKLYITLS